MKKAERLNPSATIFCSVNETKMDKCTKYDTFVGICSIYDTLLSV